MGAQHSTSPGNSHKPQAWEHLATRQELPCAHSSTWYTTQVYRDLRLTGTLVPHAESGLYLLPEPDQTPGPLPSSHVRPVLPVRIRTSGALKLSASHMDLGLGCRLHQRKECYLAKSPGQKPCVGERTRSLALDPIHPHGCA